MVAALSHFPDLKTELELLGSEHNADLTENQADAYGLGVCGLGLTGVARSFLGCPVTVLTAQGSSSGGSLNC
jgi:hypothetical protein